MVSDQMNKTIFCSLPWQELVDTCQRMETPWKDGAEEVMLRLKDLGLDEMALGGDGHIPEETLRAISGVFEDVFQKTEKLEYQQKVYLRFGIFRSIVGIFLQKISAFKGEDRVEEGLRLMQITQAIIVSSITQEPFTLKVWKSFVPYLDPRLQDIFQSIIGHSELIVMGLTGNTVYRFFNRQIAIGEIDGLLAQCHAALLAAEKRRRFSGKRGQGHTRLIIDQILRWQELGYMQHVDTITPFIRCLEAHWHHEFRLGSRQGIERMYKMKHC